MVHVEFSEAVSGMWQRFARVRVNVNVNVNNPLCLGIFLPRNERNDIWISMEYKSLLEFCFRCGVIGHTDVHCETNKVVLSNEFRGKFPAFGEWIHIGNDRTSLGIYDKPSEVTTQALRPAIPVLEVAVSTLLQNISVVKEAVQALVTVILCEDTPCTAGNNNFGVGNTTGEVSAFARLLEHSLKDACRASSASTSLSPTDTFCWR